MSRTATTVWRLTPELVLALDAQLGPPVDGYVNGTQTWLTDRGPGGETLEWRLHPVSGFRPPKGVGPYDLWDEVYRIRVSGPGEERNLAVLTIDGVDGVMGQTVPVNGNPQDNQLGTTLNFEIPAALRSAGTTQFRVSIQNPLPGPTPACSDCGSSPVSVTFATAAPLRVRVLGLAYSSGTPTTVKSPRALDYTLIRSWLGRAYPVSTLSMSTASVNANAAWPFSCNDANAQLATIRANDVAGGTDKRTHYFGLVADGGGFMRGCAASIPGSADPTAVASGPTGTPSGGFGWDTDGSYGDWYTGHELGHTYGRLHPGSGCGDSADDNHEPFTNGAISGPDGAWTGLDVGDTANGIPMAALPGAQWFDVMTYCRNQWISFYTYNGIRARLTGENALPAGAPAPKALKTSAALPPMAQVGERPEPITGAKAAPVLAAPRRAAPMLAASATVLPGSGLHEVAGPTSANGYSWYQIRTSYGTGWAAGELLNLSTSQPTPTPTPPPTGGIPIGSSVRTTTSLNMRSSASTSGAVLAVLPSGTTGTVLAGPSFANSLQWYQVQTGLGTGWVAGRYLAVSAPPAGIQVGSSVRTTSGLRLRSSASPPASAAISSTAPPSSTPARSSASSRRRSSRRTTSSTRRARSRGVRLTWSSTRTGSSAATGSTPSTSGRSRSRSARTSGRPTGRCDGARTRGPRSSSTCRRHPTASASSRPAAR